MLTDHTVTDHTVTDHVVTDHIVTDYVFTDHLVTDKVVTGPVAAVRAVADRVVTGKVPGHRAVTNAAMLCCRWFTLPAIFSLAACSRAAPPTAEQVQQAMHANASTFIQEAYREALEAHDIASIRDIINHTDYDITVADISKCEPSNTEEDTNPHWTCHVKGDITLNSKHYPIDNDIDFYYAADQHVWQMEY